jgi:hypothetical protein
METRYTGESTLDEPVSTTIVRCFAATCVEGRKTKGGPC